MEPGFSFLVRLSRNIALHINLARTLTLKSFRFVFSVNNAAFSILMEVKRKWFNEKKKKQESYNITNRVPGVKGCFLKRIRKHYDSKVLASSIGPWVKPPFCAF